MKNIEGYWNYWKSHFQNAFYAMLVYYCHTLWRGRAGWPLADLLKNLIVCNLLRGFLPENPIARIYFGNHGKLFEFFLFFELKLLFSRHYWFFRFEIPLSLSLPLSLIYLKTIGSNHLFFFGCYHLCSMTVVWKWRQHSYYSSLSVVWVLLGVFRAYFAICNQSEFVCVRENHLT